METKTRQVKNPTKSKPGYRRIARDVVTGRIVTLAYAKAHPNTTEVELRRVVKSSA